MAPNVLPNFFVIGAAKCGTTSLYDLVKRHPDVFLPTVKEPRFFCNDELFEDGIEAYARRHFSSAARFLARGDASPHYLAYEKAARRIRDSIPQEGHRFVAIFRDPTKRAWSHYWNAVYEGVEPLDFEDALEHESVRSADPTLEGRGSLRHSYFSAGLFARQLTVWLRYFDRDRFLLLFQEDLKRDPLDLARRIFRFLDVSDDVALTPPSASSNPAGMPASRRLHTFLRNPHWTKNSIKALVPAALRYRIVTRLQRWNKREFQYPPLEPRIEAVLRERYAPDVQALMEISGRDLSAWLPRSNASAASAH